VKRRFAHERVRGANSELNPQRLKQLIHLAFAIGKRVEMDADFVEQRQVEIG